MWKNCKTSLTLRVFLITFGLVLLVCAAIGGLTVSLAPVSHAALLENRLDGQLEQLLAGLEGATPAECEALLGAYARTGSADVCLTDEAGQVLFVSTHPLPEQLAPVQELTVTDEVTEVTLSVEGEATGMAVLQQDAEAGEEQLLVVEERGKAGYRRSRSITLADGSPARLVLTGSMEGAQQTRQAVYRLLPWLALLALGLSLAVAWIFARFITRPVVELSRVAQSMAAQDFSVRWQGGRSDELGMLGNSLNSLSDGLNSALSGLRQANAALEQDILLEREMERQRSVFFAAASHELKTPVTILQGQLSGMLGQVGVYRDRDKYLARSLAVTERMGSLIREILTISRLEAGDLCMAQVDLSALAERLVRENEELAESRRMSVAADILPGITVQGNESLLQNALDNLLLNALLYSPEGETVRLALGQGCLSVENTGVSLPEDALNKLFQPFYRVEGSRSRSSGGSGLGLYLVGCIAKQHGMRTEVSNTENGVRFRLLWDE